EAKDLLEFQAEVKTNMHAFTWSVWENQYVESFVLERCTLGETFVPIYEEVGTPYSGHTSYRHEVIAPKGEVSYRVLLKQIQGDLLISDTITFAPIPNSIEADSLTLKAWPNPFLDQLKLEIGSPENSSFYALITNENAQIIWEDTFEGTNSYYEKTLNLGHLPSGIYYLSVRGEREQKHLKLIKR
ncbi:MAG: T9SS type A sorting domain-containing protein, partial [Bacteroidota bacterium]